VLRIVDWSRRQVRVCARVRSDQCGEQDEWGSGIAT
jgi:hypothetical protein